MSHSSWSRLSSDFLRYWEERCLAVINDGYATIAGKKKPSEGDLAGIELQERVLAAIRRELATRETI